MSYGAWVATIDRRRRPILFLSLLLCLAAALSLTRLRLELNVVEMLPRGAPAFDDFKSFVTDFGELDELLILIDGAPPRELQDFADAFARRVSALDTVTHVHARIDVEAMREGILGKYLYQYLPEDAYSELARRLTPQGIEEQVTADRAMLQAPFDLAAARLVEEDPLGLRRIVAERLARAYGQSAGELRGGYFASGDGEALLVFVRPRQSAFDVAFSGRLVRQLRAAEADVRVVAGAGVRVRYTGSYLFALEDAATMRRDITRYTLLALLGVLGVFALGYRNLRILPFVTYPLVLTTVTTFALSLVIFEQLNVLSLSFAAILYGLSIDAGIHFYTRFLQERRERDLRAAITATLAGLGRANVAASVTTAAAFAVMGFSCLGAVSQIGWLTALGVLLNTVQFFTVYPALGFVLLRGRAAQNLETPRLARLAAWSARRRRLVIGGAVLGAVLAGLGGRRVASDVELIRLRPGDSAAARVQEEIAERFGSGTDGGAVLVRRARLEDALADAEVVARRLGEYAQRGLIGGVSGVDGVLPSEQTQRRRLARYEALPRTAAIETLRETLARQGFVPGRFEEFFAEFARPRHDVVALGDPALDPLSFLIDRHVRRHDGSFIVAVYVQPPPGGDLSTLAARLHQELKTLDFHVAARSLLEDELGEVLSWELKAFLVFSLAANAVLLWVTLSSARAAGAVLAPVVLVVLLLFGAMGAAGVPLDPVNLVVIPLVLGLGVDDGVYILGAHAGEVGQAVRQGGRALVVTSLTTVAGFGFLGLSRYPALAGMGVLSGAGLILSLFLSLTLLPAIVGPGVSRGSHGGSS